MADIRLQRMAQLLVQYSLGIKISPALGHGVRFAQWQRNSRG